MINSRFNDRGVNATGDDRGFGFADKNYNISWQVQIANRKNIQNLNRNLLQNTCISYAVCCHYMNPDQDACSITYEQYATNKFIIGITFEKMNSSKI